MNDDYRNPKLGAVCLVFVIAATMFIIAVSLATWMRGGA